MPICHRMHLGKRQCDLKMNPARCFWDHESHLYKALVKPQVLLAIWVTHFDRKETHIKTGATGMIQAMDSLFYKRKLKGSGLFRQSDPSLRGDILALCKYSWRINTRKEKEHFNLKDNELAAKQRNINQPLRNSGWKLCIGFQLSEM